MQKNEKKSFLIKSSQDLKTPKFNEEEAKKNLLFLLNKQKQYTHSLRTDYTKDYKEAHQKKRTVNKISKKQIEEFLQENPYQIINEQEWLQNEREILQGEQVTYDFNKNTKIYQLQKELQKEYNKNPNTQSNNNSEQNYQKIFLEKNSDKFDIFETDLKPEDWIRICQENNESANAKSIFFINGEYQWQDVKVISYDQISNRYLIQKIGDQKIEKKVIRLSLCFNQENKEEFFQRLQKCQLYHKLQKQQNAFQLAINYIPIWEIKLLPQQILQNIIANYSDKKYNKKQLQIVQDLLNNIQTNYEFLNKKSQYEQKLKINMKEYFSFQKIFQKLQQQYSQDKYSVILQAKQINRFNSWLNLLQKQTVFKISENRKSIKIFLAKSFQMKEYNILNFEYIYSNQIIELDELIQLQQDYFSKHSEILKVQWRDYTMGDIWDILRIVPKYHKAFNDIESYENPNNACLKKIIYWMDISYKNDLEQFMIKTFNKYIQTLKQYQQTKPQFNNKLTLIRAQLKYQEGKQKKNQQDYRIIFLQPDEQELTSKLQQPIHWIIKYLNNYQTMETDFIKILGKQSQQIFNLKVESDIFQNYLIQIQNTVQNLVKETDQVIQKFQPFSFLLQNSTEKIVKENLKGFKQNGPIIKKQEIIQNMDQVIQQINLVFSDFIIVNMLYLDAQHLKETLIEKCQLIKKSYFKKIQEIITDQLQQLYDQQTVIKNSLKNYPQNEKEFVQLKTTLQNIQTILNDQETQCDNIYEHIMLIQEHGQQLNQDSTNKYWILRIFPYEIKRMLFDAQKILQNRDIFFTQNLLEEKQKFVEQLDHSLQQFEQIKQFRNIQSIQEYAKITEEFGTKLEQLQEEKQNINEKEQIFSQNVTAYENFEQLTKQFQYYRLLWNTAFSFQSMKEQILISPLSKIVFSKVIDDLQQIENTLKNQICSYFETNEDQNALYVCEQINLMIIDFKKQTPILKLLTQDCIQKKPSNWVELFELINIQCNQQTVSLDILLQSNIQTNIQQIEQFIDQVSKEFQLEVSFNQQVIQALDEMKLCLKPYKNDDNLIIEQFEMYFLSLENLIYKIDHFKQSRFSQPIIKQIQSAEIDIISSLELLDELKTHQKNWIYLCPILNQEDLKKKMPMEKQIFEQIDSEWLEILTNLKNNSFIFRNFDSTEIQTTLKRNNEFLEQIMKSLKDYLESKWSDFPNFYFMSDLELIELISISQDEENINIFIHKCFQQIESLIVKDNGKIIGFVSENEEKIMFQREIDKFQQEQGTIEKWLYQISSFVKETNKVNTH